MSVAEGCRLTTDRLMVVPWHDGARRDELVEFVVALLVPAVTAGLPPEWRGNVDRERAARWIDERDAESTVLLVSERATGSPIGLLIAGEDESAHGLRIGYLLAEQHWGRGLATELVSAFVTWCRATGRVRSLAGGVDTDNMASAKILTNQGFVPAGDRVGGDQVFRLVLAPETATISVRPETPADVDAIDRVVAAAFDSRVEATLVERIRASPGYIPELALVAEVDGEVVGHVMISEAVVHHERGDRSIVMLSPLAVAPAHQRRGVGAQLVRAAVAAADDRGEPLVVLEGNPAYYSRFGFEHSTSHGLTLPLPDWAPSEAGQVLLLSGYRDPNLRGRVVYPAPFDGLE